MAYLILVRHGVSTYNAKGIWTGWADPSLAPAGIEEAKQAGLAIKDLKIDLAYVGTLVRGKQTLSEILKVLKIKIPTEVAWELNERNYGIYINKNKWEVRKQVGEKTFQKIRRSFDFPIEAGESLKQVYERAVPYYCKEIFPKIKQGKNILLSIYGNSMRALVKYLDKVSDKDIPLLEIATGQVYVYKINSKGKILSKEIRIARKNTV
ncbi:MAG: 2,3-bisphosphoglycerate-dependent phosphoglycerate mutase [Candidatus Daviesbacteria bacterium]|nr:2,3-bisphosphoglycerate-dependent phosphoglycerate mutase [Candidatus Daviesbacteria bacterium]